MQTGNIVLQRGCEDDKGDVVVALSQFSVTNTIQDKERPLRTRANQENIRLYSW